MKENKTGLNWKDPNDPAVREYRRQKSREYLERNKEKYAESTRKWQAENKDKISANFKKYYEENKEKHLAYMREYHRKNRERLAEQARQRNFRKSQEQQDEPVDNINKEDV